MAQYEDLEVDQGSDAKWQVKMLDADGTVRDLTDFTVRGKVNRSYDADSSESLNFTANVLNPASAGILEFRLTNEQTDTMTRRRYVYDLEVEYIDDDSASIVERVLEGNLMVSKSVTRFD